MDGFTKLFGCLLTSSVWAEDDKTRLVWITMLALQNGRHVVEASVPGLANLARVDVEACRAAIKKLESPDPDSRSPEYEGRRIERCDGGWLILNGDKYQHKLSEAMHREYKTKWQRNDRHGKSSLKASKPLPGELEYERAARNGANGDQLQAIVDRHLRIK